MHLYYDMVSIYESHEKEYDCLIRNHPDFLAYRIVWSLAGLVLKYKRQIQPSATLEDPEE